MEDIEREEAAEEARPEEVRHDEVRAEEVRHEEPAHVRAPRRRPVPGPAPVAPADAKADLNTLVASEKLTQPEVTTALAEDHRDSVPVLRNAEREARGLVEARRAEEPVDPRRSMRVSNGRGPRNAADLALLLRTYPYAVNELHRLDEVERENGVDEPDGWEADPVLLLQDAKIHNFSFPAENGTLIPPVMTPRDEE